MIKTIDVRRDLTYLYYDFQPKIQFFQIKTQFFIMNTQLYSRMRSMLFLLTFSLSTLLTYAQDRRVTGKVTGGDGQGIPGVSVLLKGTQTGTTTDANGLFAINLKSGKDILAFSGIGFKSTEVKVGTQSNLNVTLNEDVSSLDEIVVTGYSSSNKKESTAAISTVKAKDLIAAPSGNVDIAAVDSFLLLLE